MSSQFTRTIPTLRIFDSAKAREFYVGFLGFKVDFEHRFEADLPLFMQISLGDIILYLSEHHGDCAPGAKVVIETSGLADYHANLIARNTAMRALGSSSSRGADQHDHRRSVLQPHRVQRAPHRSKKS